MYFYKETIIEYNQKNINKCNEVINYLLDSKFINEFKTKNLVYLLKSSDDLLAQKVINYILSRKDSKEISELGLNLIKSQLEKNWSIESLKAIKKYSSSKDIKYIYKLDSININYNIEELLDIDDIDLNEQDKVKKQEYLDERDNMIQEINRIIGEMTTSGVREKMKKLQELYEILVQNPRIKDYFDKEVNIFNEAPLNKLGLEPMEVKDVSYLYNKLTKVSLPIKAALLEQSILAGIGNIYADEICYACKISPFKKANELTKIECENIIKEASRILTEAIELGGSTIKSFQSTHGVDGLFQQKLLVYGKTGIQCINCNTPIEKTFIKATKLTSRVVKKMGARGHINNLYNNALKRKNTAHAYLFTGEKGTPKKESALRASFRTKRPAGSFAAALEPLNSGEKCNLDEVIVVTKTTDGTLLWLEQGNSKTGLTHIQDRHLEDFASQGVDDIPQLINEILKTEPIKKGQNQKGLYADYALNGNSYRLAYGTNGYIVSFYPID